MSFPLQYEQINNKFNTKRQELLDMLIDATPRHADLHRRQWRVQQLENSITDIKSTIAACNIQIEQERAVLDELSAENTRLTAQQAKLMEDLKLLEGITGMTAVLPSDGDAEVLTQIDEYANNFREKSADFYFNVGQIKQEIVPDTSIAKESSMMVATFHDFLDLQFNTRATEASMSREIDDLTIKADDMKKKVEDEEAAFNRKFKNSKKQAQDEFDAKQEELINKVDELRHEYAAIQKRSKIIQKKLNEKIDKLIEKERVAQLRYGSAKSFDTSQKENMRRRAMELEFELDRFENRLASIRLNPNVVDQSLINISLVLGEKSKLINKLIRSMRTDISNLNEEIRKALR